jgi:site-specific DNA-methyltransferase (adenine-specific)
MPDKCIDLVLDDPPFGIGNFIQTSGNITGKGRQRGKEVRWNDEIPCPEYFTEIVRISKHRIIWGANYFNCFEQDGGAIVWVKKQLMPNFSKAEIASCSFHKRVELVTLGWTNFLGRKVTTHPSERPVQLYLWCIRKYTKIGDLILDPHCGSGSVCVASKMLNRKFIGIDINKNYCEMSRKRLKQIKRGCRLGLLD